MQWSGEENAGFTTGTPWIPVNGNSSRIHVSGQADDWQKPYFEATQAALAAAEPLPNVPYWSEVQQAINDALKETLVEGKDVKTTLDKYAAQIEAAKNKSN